MNRVLIQYAEGRPIGQLDSPSGTTDTEPLVLPPFIRPKNHPEDTELKQQQID